MKLKGKAEGQLFWDIFLEFPKYQVAKPTKGAGMFAPHPSPLTPVQQEGMVVVQGALSASPSCTHVPAHWLQFRCRVHTLAFVYFNPFTSTMNTRDIGRSHWASQWEASHWEA